MYFPCPSTGINHFPKEPWLYDLDAIGVLNSIEVPLLQGLSVGKLGNTVWICLFTTYRVWYVHIHVNIYNIYANIHLHILLFLFLSICTENHNFKPVTPIPVQHHWQFILVFSLSTFVTLPPDRNMIPIILSVFTYLINFPIYNQCPMATDASSPTCLLLNTHHLHH